MRTYLVVLALIAGCVTPEEQAAKQAQYANALRQRCYAYGFRSGEPGMANCVMQLDLMVQRQRAASDAAAASLGMQLLNNSGPQTPTPGFNCWRMGNYLQCQ